MRFSMPIKGHYFRGKMFTLKQLRKQIWHLHFEHQYDLTMHFLRYQEYYESPRFKKMPVPLVDMMDWYTKNVGNGVFTYPNDWAGFNLPGEEILEIHTKGIPDPNRYDHLMMSLFEFIRAKEEDRTDFYIIGTSEDDGDMKGTFNHELAHGFFFADKKYKEKTTKMVMGIPTKTRNFIFKCLKQYEYDDSFLVDETQAYLATGLYGTFDKPSVQQYVPQFEALFKKTAGRLRKK